MEIRPKQRKAVYPPSLCRKRSSAIITWYVGSDSPHYFEKRQKPASIIFIREQARNKNKLLHSWRKRLWEKNISEVLTAINYPSKFMITKCANAGVLKNNSRHRYFSENHNWSYQHHSALLFDFHPLDIYAPITFSLGQTQYPL